MSYRHNFLVFFFFFINIYFIFANSKKKKMETFVDFAYVIHIICLGS